MTKRILYFGYCYSLQVKRTFTTRFYQNYSSILTIPNALTFSRIAMTPMFPYLLLNEYYAVSCGLLATAGLTDLLDGFIARRWPSQASQLGSFIDPLADKLIIGSLTVSLAYVNLLPTWLAVLILSRDAVLIIAGTNVRFVAVERRQSNEPLSSYLRRVFDPDVAVQLKPTLISKVNTSVQMTCVGIALASPLLGVVSHPHLAYVWWATASSTALSIASYLTKDRRAYYTRHKR